MSAVLHEGGVARDTTWTLSAIWNTLAVSSISDNTDKSTHNDFQWSEMPREQLSDHRKISPKNVSEQSAETHSKATRPSLPRIAAPPLIYKLPTALLGIKFWEHLSVNVAATATYSPAWIKSSLIPVFLCHPMRSSSVHSGAFQCNHLRYVHSSTRISNYCCGALDINLTSMHAIAPTPHLELLLTLWIKIKQHV